MSPTDELIRNVSDTAIWVAMYRAIESGRRKRASRLAGNVMLERVGTAQSPV